VEYQEESVVLSPGDRLFLHSDSFTEASDSGVQSYGAGSVSDAIAASRCRLIQSTLNNLLDTLKCWRQNHQFSDDLSMPGADFTGEPQTA
jgi:serine phosphatase RsbU (regulator of sigma subunit)